MKALPWYGNIRELQHAVEKAVILSDGTLIDEDGISGETPLREKPLEEVQTIDEMESRLIGKTIRDCGGNLSQVAAKFWGDAPDAVQQNKEVWTLAFSCPLWLLLCWLRLACGNGAGTGRR